MRKTLIKFTNFHKRAMHTKSQFKKAVANKKRAIEKYADIRWDDTVYFLILLGKSDKKFSELQDIEFESLSVHQAQRRSIIEAIYLAKSVEAMEINLSSKLSNKSKFNDNIKIMKDKA